MSANNARRPNLPLRRWVQCEGIASVQQRLGVSRAAIGHWMTGRRRVPAHRAVQIEEASGGRIRRAELRPDLFADNKP